MRDLTASAANTAGHSLSPYRNDAIHGRWQVPDERELLIWNLPAQCSFLTLKTIGAIHFEARRLYLKRFKFFHQPSPPVVQQTQDTLLRTLEQDTQVKCVTRKAVEQ